MKYLKFIVAVLFLFWEILSNAQFQLSGNDPDYVNWYFRETPSYKILYPEGADSLVWKYGLALEQSRIKVGLSAGYTPGEMYKKKMPVILHCFQNFSNGLVVWAPQRMELYTSPDTYNITPTPNIEHLSIHESRHVAQMQFGRSGIFKPFHYLFGEMFAGGLAGLYPNKTFLEGDAVVAETALTLSGRGRKFSFLEYYMPSFDSGDYRNKYRWEYGSQRWYAPDYYTVGYMTIGGIRYLYNEPFFTKKYFNRIQKNPIRIFNFQKTLKEISGKKQSAVWKEITEAFQKEWNKNAQERAPFMPAEIINKLPHWHTEYHSPFISKKGEIYAIKKGLAESTSLIKITPDGKEKHIRAFSGAVGHLHYDPNTDRIYFSESIPDIRWTLKRESIIRYIYTDNPQKIHNLTSEESLHNPSPSEKGDKIAAIEYPQKGGSNIVLLDTETGKRIKTITAPDTVQITEAAWIKDSIYISGLSEHGFGIYSITKNGKFANHLQPHPVQIQHLEGENGNLYFECDRTGVNEFYSWKPDNKELTQITSSKYGIHDAIFNKTRDALYYSSLAPAEKPEMHKYGKLLYKTNLKGLTVKKAEWEQYYKYPIADTLSNQEKRLQKGILLSTDYKISDAQPYLQKPRLSYIHSWVPFYFNYDKIPNISFDYLSKTISPGLMLMIQNTLGNFSGIFGFSYEKSPINGKRRPVAIAKFNYKKFYPVFDISLEFNRRSSFDVFKKIEKGNIKIESRTTERPYFLANIKTYIPLNFSSGGWQRGIIPQLNYNISNDFLDTGIMHKSGNSVPFNRLGFSVRGYISKIKAPSEIYPDFGIGAEIGAVSYPFLKDYFNPAIFGYVYGYLPGIRKDQGLRLTAKIQMIPEISRYAKGKNALNILPRGFAGNELLNQYIGLKESFQYSFTADYGIPIYVGDLWYLSPLIYIKNFVLKPFADFSFYGKNNFFSTGCAFSLRAANIAWFPFETELGISIAYNGGSYFKDLTIQKISLQRTHLGFIFNTVF